jgi:NAD(P)-dependent dehydrogenase (short-subunit alcohol dehydrogenase family)
LSTRLGHFLLTHLLLDALLAAPGSRVVTLGSGLHLGGMGQPVAALDFDDLDMARKYDGRQAYARSKLANILFACELDRRREARGLTSSAVSPGEGRCQGGVR